MTKRKERGPFGSKLIYLVDCGGGIYKARDGIGYSAGLTVWADSRVQFQTYSDAKDAADKHGRHAKVVKLRIMAKIEQVKFSRPQSTYSGVRI